MANSDVVVVGAGPSGLATAACLTQLSIPYKLLEREDCIAPLWKKKSYDRLHLHLAKQYCELPHMKFPPTYPKYVPKKDFIQYLDNYVAHFDIDPLYQRCVDKAGFDEDAKLWRVKARNGANDDVEEEYVGRFLVVATGDTSDPFVPKIEGLSNFEGKVMHSIEYKSGKEYKGKRVLVVGAGNSGMEIAFDLANHGAITSIVIRSPVHVLSGSIMDIGLFLGNRLPLHMVDTLMVIMSNIAFGDVTKYGLTRPREGPFSWKRTSGKFPVVDVGTYQKISKGEIKEYHVCVCYKTMSEDSKPRFY